MKKLNNKGITTIEVLLCFALVVIITVSMYATISSYNDRRIIESYKEQVYSYKNILTKTIQDDFIKIGLTHVSYKKELGSDKITTYTLDCNLKDGTQRQLVIKQRLGYSSYHISGYADQNDYFMIQYGVPGKLVNYPLPDLGETKFKNSGSPAQQVVDSSDTSPAHTVKDLCINNVLIKIGNDADVFDSRDANVLSIQIGLYHPELLTRYGIYIVCPIDYMTSGSDGTTKFPF